MKLGRKSRFEPKYLPIIYKYTAGGHTEQGVARRIGISDRTWAYWKEKHPEILQVLKKAKDDPDAAVERSLYRMATGYHQEVMEPVFDRKNGEVAYATYKKYFAPNVTAAIFWLKNRRKEQWADTHHVEQTVNVFVDMPQRETREEWIARVEREERERAAIDVTPKIP